MGTSLIKFGLKKATFGEKSFPILSKFPWDLYWENKIFKSVKRTIPCERETIKWASKLGKKIKAMGKKGRLAGSSSTFFVVVVVCLFVFCGLFRDHLGIELNFKQTRSQLKRLKTGESSREGCWEGSQSEIVNFVSGTTRTESACIWLLLVLLILSPTQFLLLGSVRSCCSQLSTYHFNVFSVNIRVIFRTSWHIFEI